MDLIFDLTLIVIAMHLTRDNHIKGNPKLAAFGFFLSLLSVCSLVMRLITILND